MDPDDNVCLCFSVSLRKIRTFLKTQDPQVASLISDCLSAGTGCQWCVPFLKELHRQHACGEGIGPGGEPDLRVSPEQYAKSRLKYRVTGEREFTPEQGDESESRDPQQPMDDPGSEHA